jgi:bifunctional enzyme CysN/CysC
MAVQSGASVATLHYRINVNSLHREQTSELKLNEIGRVTLEISRPLAFDAYQKNRATGAFILIDRMSNATVAAGMIVDRQPAERALARRSTAADAGSNLRGQPSHITATERARRLQQQPFVLWLTGLPRSGKSSVAYALEQALFERGLTVHVLDGENLRVGISRDLGFSAQDRWENQRRAAEIANLCCDLGLITIVALVSPLAADRAQVRRLIGDERYLEVYCNTPLEICEQRDDSGLYQRARAGELQNVTGIDAPFESPLDADLILDTAATEVQDNITMLTDLLEQRGLLKN